MKIKKTEVTCDICGDRVKLDTYTEKSYITLKGTFADGIGYLSRLVDNIHSEKFHICHQCLHDLGTLIKRLREEKKKELKELKDE